MKIITWNVNGIRAIERKQELQHLVAQQAPDILMLQETKGAIEQFSQYLTEHPDYQQYYSSAVKKGYAGTAIWMRNKQAQKVANIKFNTVVPKAPNADEGRIANLSFDCNRESWDLFSIYFPNGGKSDQAWLQKLEFYARIQAYMNKRHRQGRVVIVGGDMNVAHNAIDIARAKANDGKIGFHPKERAWMDRLIADGWADVWRQRNPQVADVYSWWHMISKGRERNVGWRIDYFLMAQKYLDKVSAAEYLQAQMGSDHCPMLLQVK